jgi:DNA-binding MarR family transcriptional regulator
MPKESLSEIEYEALANLRYRIRKFRQFSADAATRLGLAPPEHQALLAIKGLGIDGEMSVSSLAEALFLAPATATELTEGLRDRGFLTIATNRIVVRLTDQAEELLRRLTPAHLYEIREMAPELMQALRALQDHRRMEMAAWMQ